MKPINEQINPKFVIQAKKLAKFTRILHKILPVECHDHVKVANIRDQNLMLITDSPVWTTRLRQLSPQILTFLRENSPGDDSDRTQIIHHVQIRTRYHASDSDEQQISNKKDPHKLHISEKTATLLSQSADSIKHQALKSALLRVASHTSKQDKLKK
ncbi:MAG: DUF721 domain-containing protein [Gammaproteobacteria bacterium]|nr:DUF721 domain-containing protein [Gammaproteobacteria bacterium]